MSIQAGRSLLHYRVVEKIGEGGMGVVWKAVDTTLDREVAVKVLPEALSRDVERLARFEREAKLLAQLNHPNIATVHGLHEAEGVRFLTMELVDGEDLSERLARGAIPLDEALSIAKQIADGVEAAHAAGVIHRDLKPANVKIGADGRVKVLDFGLARAFETSPPSGEISPTMSPTLTSAGTLAGAILGTAAYMSPEQARGHPVDNRADVWAFGVVLYEMLSGTSAFRGETVSDTLASVLKLDPDFEALPPTVPNRIRRLVTRCLQKNRKQRLHHIADARIALDETLAGVPDVEAPGAGTPKSRMIERVLWLAAVAAIGLIASLIAWSLRPAPAPTVHRKIILALDGQDSEEPALGASVISPDGKRIAYKNGKTVFVRDLDDWVSREIPAAAGSALRFWSPDGQSIGFVKDEKLWRVSADGGQSSSIADLSEDIHGATWSSDGTIIIADHSSLYAIPERGGDPKELITAEKGSHFHDVHALPDGRGALASVHGDDVMRLQLLAGGKLRTLLEFETRYPFDSVYSTTGHVLYHRGETNEGIWALPFSLGKLTATGEPFLVAAGGDGPSVSKDGTLVYQPVSGSTLRRLVWVDRKGELQGVIGRPREGFSLPSFSPGGGRIAVAAGSYPEVDIWIVDVNRGTPTRLTFGERTVSDPTWTPDGKRVLYSERVDDAPSAIMITYADGSGEPQKVTDGRLFSLSPDGRYVVFSREGEETEDDIWYVPLDVEAEPVIVVQSAADEIRGRVSPDGAYIAYESDESGVREIYIKRFPSGEGKWQASIDGGHRPRWSPKGDELFWIMDGHLTVVDVQTEPELKLGTPRNLFSWRPGWLLDYHEFDITDDAERFVLIAPEEEPDVPNQVMLVENWFAEFDLIP